MIGREQKLGRDWQDSSRDFRVSSIQQELNAQAHQSLLARLTLIITEIEGMYRATLNISTEMHNMWKIEFRFNYSH